MSRKHYPKKTHDITMKTSLPCQKDDINVSEKMASLKKVEERMINEKIKSVNATQVPADKSFETQSTLSTTVGSKAFTTAASAPPPPVMAQRTFLFARKKTVWEKLNHKFQQLINRIKSMHSLKRRQP